MMPDPLIITANAILNFAFQEFTKAGAGELAKKSVDGALDLAKNLRDKLQSKFRGNVKAETAIQVLETEGSPVAFSKLEVYLDDAMTDDDSFSQELRQIAQQIINIQNQNTGDEHIYNQTAGRDIINVDKIEGGSNKFGGS